LEEDIHTVMREKEAVEQASVQAGSRIRMEEVTTDIFEEKTRLRFYKLADQIGGLDLRRVEKSGKTTLYTLQLEGNFMKTWDFLHGVRSAVPPGRPEKIGLRRSSKGLSMMVGVDVKGKLWPKEEIKKSEMDKSSRRRLAEAEAFFKDPSVAPVISKEDKVVVKWKLVGLVKGKDNEALAFVEEIYPPGKPGSKDESPLRPKSEQLKHRGRFLGWTVDLGGFPEYLTLTKESQKLKWENEGVFDGSTITYPDKKNK